MKYTGDIDKDLKILLPHIVADGVSREHSDKLVNLAAHFYRVNQLWAKGITDTNAGRDRLKAFMEHWHEGFIKHGRWIDDRVEGKD